MLTKPITTPQSEVRIVFQLLRSTLGSLCFVVSLVKPASWKCLSFWVAPSDVCVTSVHLGALTHFPHTLVWLFHLSPTESILNPKNTLFTRIYPRSVPHETLQSPGSEKQSTNPPVPTHLHNSLCVQIMKHLLCKSPHPPRCHHNHHLHLQHLLPLLPVPHRPLPNSSGYFCVSVIIRRAPSLTYADIYFCSK